VHSLLFAASHAFDQRRSHFSLRYHAPFVKLLLLAVEELMALPQFAYQGVGYRGLKLDGNAELKRKYLDHKTEFVVGQLMTFPAFMSVSTDDSVADDFGDYVFFVFVKVRGARIARLSQLPKEAEILVPPPSVFRIKAVAKFGGRLTITLEQEACPLSYLSQAAPKSSGAHAVVSGGGSAAAASQSSSSIAAELQALADAFVSLKVGLKETCVAFAVELSKQGVMAVEDFSEVTEAEARDMMARAGMSKLQQNRVVQAEAERKSAAAAAEAQRKRDAEAAAAKKAQEDQRKVRFLWWWWWWWWCSIFPPR